MTYLELVRRLRQECGISGTASTPSAVTGQTGEMQRLVDWIASAWREIQNKYQDWRWMRRSFTGTTTSAQSEYAYTAFTDTTDVATISRFGKWLHTDAYGCPLFAIYPTSLGVANQIWLYYRPWDEFRQIYRFGPQVSGPPVCFSITPSDKIALGPAPDATGYTVTGDYQMSAQELAADANTPEMPTRFHMLIVYEAMKKYAGYESAPEVMGTATMEADKLWSPLESDQKPAIALAEPLA